MKRIVWYARTDEIERAGPFTSQVVAFCAMRLAPQPGNNNNTHPKYPKNLLVWPEEIEINKRFKIKKL